MSKKSTRIFWCSDSQFFLEASVRTHLVHKREIPAEPLAQQLSSLTTHTGCVTARQEEDDLDYASDRGHMRISLAPAIEFVEAQILGHFRVAGKFSLVSRKFLHFGETSPDHALGFISECPCHPCYAHVSAICFDVTTACGYAARCARSNIHG